MKTVCNIFRPLLNDTGNFLLFSQYTDDVSRSLVESGYDINPSRFVCLNLTSDEIDNLEHVGLVNPDMSQTNSELPRFFQNVF